MADPRDVTGPLPRVPREAAEIRRRGEELLDDVAARSRADLRVRLGRLRAAAPLIGQAALGAGIAWYLASRVSDAAEPPFFAPVAAVVSLGAALGQRLRRTVELVLGVALGVGVADLLIAQIGSGTAQLVLVVALAMSAAVLLDGGQLLVIQAANSSVLVATLVPADGGGLGGVDRFRDALIGGVVGLVIGLFLLPLNPLAVARRATVPVTEAMARGLDGVAAALRAGDHDAGLASLRALRGADPLVRAMTTAVATSEEIARIAPVRWRARDRFSAYADAAPQLDLAVRNARVLARRATVLLRSAQPVPTGLADAVSALAAGARTVGAQLGEPTEPRAARRLLVDAYATARGAQGPDTPVLELVLIAQIRSTAYDLLRATGLNRVDTLALIDG